MNEKIKQNKKKIISIFFHLLGVGVGCTRKQTDSTIPSTFFDTVCITHKRGLSHNEATIFHATPMYFGIPKAKYM